MSSEPEINENGAEASTSAEVEEKHSDSEANEPKQSDEPKEEKPVDGSSTSSSDKEVKMYVGNLPDNCRRASLEELFNKYGKVTQCDRVKNFAFVVSFASALIHDVG